MYLSEIFFGRLLNMDMQAAVPYKAFLGDPPEYESTLSFLSFLKKEKELEALNWLVELYKNEKKPVDGFIRTPYGALSCVILLSYNDVTKGGSYVNWRYLYSKYLEEG